MQIPMPWMSLNNSNGIRLAMDAYRCLNMTFGVRGPGRLQAVDPEITL
jgi:hypothetical protein